MTIFLFIGNFDNNLSYTPEIGTYGGKYQWWITIPEGYRGDFPSWPQQQK